MLRRMGGELTAPRGAQTAEGASGSLAVPSRGDSERAAPSEGAGAGWRQATVLLASLAAVLAVEVLIARGHVLAGQIADAVLVLLLVNAGAAPIIRSDAAASALRALAIVPLARVATLGLPLKGQSQASSELFVALTIAIAAWRFAPAVGVRRSVVVSVRSARVQLAAAGVGLTLSFAAYLAGAPDAAPDGAGASRVLLAVVATTAAAGLSAATFLDGPAQLVLVMALAGLAFGAAVARTGALGGAVAGHVLLAVGASVVWPALLGHEAPTWPSQSPATIVLATLVAVATAFTLTPIAKLLAARAAPPWLTPAAGERPLLRADLRRALLPALVLLPVLAAGVVGFVTGRENSQSNVETAPKGAANLRAQEHAILYRRRANTALKRLDARRVVGRRALARARTPAGQARAARRLAADYRAAYGALRTPPPEVPGGSVVASALRRTADGYRRLALATARSDERGYRTARRTVAAGEARLVDGLILLNRTP